MQTGPKGEKKQYTISAIWSGVGPQLLLDPNFVTGFTDGEGTFTVSISKDNRVRKTARGDWRLR